YKVDKTLGEANAQFRSVAWSPDGKTLAAGTAASTILYDEAGKMIRTLEGQGAALAWSKDGKNLAASSLANASVKVWEAGNGDIVKTIAGAANLLAYHPEGKSLI